MNILSSTSDLVQVVTSAIGTVSVHASWVDNASGTITPGRTNTANITTATTTTVVGSPGASTQRNLKTLVVANTDASVAQTITVQHTDGTTVRQLWKGTITAGESVVKDIAGNWTEYDSSGIAKVSNGPGRFIKSTFLTTGTTFTTDAQTRQIRVRVQAGGGGGGGANTAATSGAMGGGGAAGGYAERIFTVLPNTAYTYAIGAAGTAGAAAAGTGGTGGNTTFTVSGVTVTANGGLGGVGMAGGTTGLIALGGNRPAVSTNGDINASGEPGLPGHRQSATIGVSGSGGSCLFGAGGNGLITQSAGAAGVGFGAGGSGGCCINGGAAAAGGAGLAGCIVVEEFT